MITITVQDILTRDWQDIDPQDEPFCIYVIREDTTVFYVGRSNSPLDRLQQHFDTSTLTRGSGSLLGPFYKRYKDMAASWHIDLYTLEDCEHLLARKLIRGGSPYAERYMIQHFHPCINGTNNPDPSTLPERYQKRKLNLDDNAVDYLNF